MIKGQYVLLLIILSFTVLTFSQNVIDVKMSSCDGKSDPYYVHPNRIISKNIANDTLQLQLGIVKQCAFDPMVSLVIQNDSLEISITDTSTIMEMCLCCFELSIKVLGVQDTNFILVQKVLFNEFNPEIGFKDSLGYSEIKEHSNKFIFPTPEELFESRIENKFYQDSLKVGVWGNYYGNSKQLKSKAKYFINQKGLTQTIWYAIFNKSGIITEMCALSEVANGNSTLHCIDGDEYQKLYSID